MLVMPYFTWLKDNFIELKKQCNKTYSIKESHEWMKEHWLSLPANYDIEYGRLFIEHLIRPAIFRKLTHTKMFEKNRDLPEKIGFNFCVCIRSLYKYKYPWVLVKRFDWKSNRQGTRGRRWMVGPYYSLTGNQKSWRYRHSSCQSFLLGSIPPPIFWFNVLFTLSSSNFARAIPRAQYYWIIRFFFSDIFF